MFTLVVTRGGDGAGTVVSNPTGIQCGNGCVFSSPTNSPLSLAATPSAGSRFEGWAGACSGRGRCRLSGSGPIAVIARFSQVTANDSSVNPPAPMPQTQMPVVSSAIATPTPAATGPRTAPAPTNTNPMTTRSWMSAVQNVIADIKSPYKLVVSVPKKTWVRIRMDNGQTYEEKLGAGAVRMWVTDRPFAISLGNAGGARIELNGRPLPPADGVEISNVVLPQE